MFIYELYDDQDPKSKESNTVHPEDSCVICDCASLFDDLSKNK